MPIDLLRDSVFGQIVNYASNGRYLPYEDQRPGYQVPARYLLPSSSSSASTPSRRDNAPLPRTISQAPTLVNSVVSPPATLVSESGICKELEKDKEGREIDLEKRDPSTIDPEEYPYLVRFEENDQDRPQNWSSRKRNFVGLLIGLLTFSVYIASAIYTPSIPGLMEEFGASQVLATAGLTLFVTFYGIGPMLLAPMQEVPSIGRNPVYIAGLFLFLIFQVPPVFANGMAVILVFRAAAGFVGSPALATGGASMGDIYPPEHYAVALSGWSLAAVLGPVFGPVIGGFAAEGMNWRWTFLEMIWLSSFALVVLFFLLPETYEDTVLLRRAQRLRKLTGNLKIKAPCELGPSAHESVGYIIKDNMYRAMRLSMEPSILVANSYIALVYAVFYLWFEAFPLVFTEQHHFSLGLSGLPYLGFVVSGVITLACYIYYQLHVPNPYLDAHPDVGPEIRLKIALFASVCIPISLFGFGWTAQTHQHWILPIIFAAIYLPGIFLAFQSILVYVSLSYPKYAASVLAGNDLFRSVFASVFPLFGTRFFTSLGLGGGSSLLAGVSILMIPLLFLIMRYGATLRARSSFAE
ncbi:MFS transporter [Sporobolomyces salmoneus]|uniref:MFS transporter n=1 Tax=Sporobolomyces salmoneus TaxID=183962 RepID=UPI00316C8E55